MRDTRGEDTPHTQSHGLSLRISRRVIAGNGFLFEFSPGNHPSQEPKVHDRAVKIAPHSSRGGSEQADDTPSISLTPEPWVRSPYRGFYNGFLGVKDSRIFLKLPRTMTSGNCRQLTPETTDVPVSKSTDSSSPASLQIHMSCSALFPSLCVSIVIIDVDCRDVNTNF